MTTKEELEKEAEDIVYGMGYDTYETDGHSDFVVQDILVKFAEPREKRITDLEKENTALRQDWDVMKSTITDYDNLCDKLEKENADLEKENAELKEKSKRQSNNYKHDVDMLIESNEQNLTNAKEIIKTLLSSKTKFDEGRFALWAWKEDVNKAEQFIKDNEV